MKRLFLFGVGGSGARVTKSLACLLASGVALRDAEGKPFELVPILIDTDDNNRDTVDCVTALELYHELHRSHEPGRAHGFFETAVTPLHALAKEATVDVSRSFRMRGGGTENRTFRDFIDFNNIPNPHTRQLLEVLYSQQNMTDVLTGGFLGSPHVGAVVLSVFKDSADFRLFATAFSTGDRMFIASSIFGGTGAAGFPLLVKALRSTNQAEGAATALREAPIGGLTLLPYFKLQQDDESHIDSNIFISKTRAALSYYHTNLAGVDALYYLADSSLSTYPNHDSGFEQHNSAHLVELLGALSLVHFAGLDDNVLSTEARSFECALGSDADVVDFATLGEPLSRVIAKPLTQLFLLSILERDHLEKALHQPWARDSGFRPEFLSSPQFLRFRSFVREHFHVWLEELANNRRGFEPFTLDTRSDDLSTARKDRVVKRRFWSRFSAETLDKGLNKMTAGTARGAQSPDGSLGRFLEMYWTATGQAVADVYGE